MTTWTNTVVNAGYPKHNTRGRLKERHYELAGVSGDTGGTLTVYGWKKIYNAIVTVYTASGAAAALTWRISTNTVIVAYTNPAAGHTVAITVIGE